MATEFEQALERMEAADVPQNVIDDVKGAYEKDLDASSLRRKVGELEARWKNEAEPAIQKATYYETQPKRIEALKGIGVDYAAMPKYGQEVLDSLPADKLDDKEFVANFVQSKGFEITPQQAQPGDQSGAAQVVSQAVSGGQAGTPVDRDALLRSAKSAEEVLALTQKYPVPSQ